MRIFAIPSYLPVDDHVGYFWLPLVLRFVYGYCDVVCRHSFFQRDATFEEAPTILEDYANTASAGSIIVFHKHRAGFERGEHGAICSFGAGYSIGSLIVRKC